ncbi:MAG: DUF6125 family protein [Syntrophomonadaceae bacterium]|nr:DUF6125 family protein [Syntrophomonadaceae bacterium]
MQPEQLAEAEPKLKEIKDLTRDELLQYIGDIVKNWAAIDGLWFQAVERAYGMDMALKLDGEVWSRYPVIEANRIKRMLNLPDRGGVRALMQAFKFRNYASLNRQTIMQTAENKVVFQMNECRQQAGRKRAGLPPHPCKEPGYCEYSSFASTIDPRFKTTCICCPPDETPEGIWCAWEFELANG